MFGLEDVETFPGFQHDSLGRACQEDDIPSTMHVDEVTDGEIPYEYGKDGPSKVRVVVWSDDMYWCKLHVGLLHAASACFALQVQRLCRFLVSLFFFLIFVSHSLVHFLVFCRDWGMFPICRCESSVELLGRGRASKDPLACNLPNSGREISHVLVGTVYRFLQVSTRFQDVSGWGSRFKSFQVVSSFPEAMRSSPLWNAILLHWKLWHSSSARVKRLVWRNPSFDWKKIRALREPCELAKKRCRFNGGQTGSVVNSGLV